MRTVGSRGTSATHRRRAFLILAAALVAALLSARARAEDQVAAGAQGTPPDPYPVASPLYEDLRVLHVRSGLRVPGLTARPQSGFTLAAAVAADSATPRTLPAFARSRAELADPLVTSGLDTTASPHPKLLRVGDAESRLTISAFAGFRAEACPDRGFVLTDSTRFGLKASWFVWPGFHLYEELYVADVPGGHEFADPLIADSDIIIFQDRVFAALHTRIADLTFGRDRLAWGPGVTGSLLLAATARPFTQLRVERFFFDRRVHAVIVNGALSQAENRFIAYHRLDWQATRRLRIAFAEGARYNADFVEPLYLAGIIPYPLVGRLLERDNDSRQSDALVRNNVMWDIDASYLLRDGVEIYGEILIDDLGTATSETPTRLGYQLGTFVAADVAGYPATLNAEWTRVWRYVYSVFYDADFTHEGVPLGHPEGPDSRLVHVRGAVEVRPGIEVGVIGERLDRGEDGLGVYWDPDDPAAAGADASEFGGTVERQWRLLGSFRFLPARPFAATIELGGAWVTNAVHEPGAERSGLLGRVMLGLER